MGAPILFVGGCGGVLRRGGRGPFWDGTFFRTKIDPRKDRLDRDGRGILYHSLGVGVRVVLRV